MPWNAVGNTRTPPYISEGENLLLPKTALQHMAGGGKVESGPLLLAVWLSLSVPEGLVSLMLKSLQPRVSRPAQQVLPDRWKRLRTVMGLCPAKLDSPRLALQEDPCPSSTIVLYHPKT